MAKLSLSVWGLAWRFLWARPLSTGLNLLLLVLALASLALLGLVGQQLDQVMRRDLRGIDLVVGAKGSPLQLILAGVFHLDVPSGNIPLAEVEALRRHPQVAEVIPLSLGDSAGGFRIVGTEPAYLALAGAELTTGRLWQAGSAGLEAVIGHRVATQTAWVLGGRFVGSHGLVGGGETHVARPFTVVGVLAPCGCALDRLVLTSLQAVWDLHERDTAWDEAERRLLEAEREVTVALLRYRSPLAAVTLPRFIQSTTPMQAAAPAIEMSRLMRFLGMGLELLQAYGALLLAVAGISLFLALVNAVRERRTDLALLRLLGAPPTRVAGLLLAEALWLGLLATCLGLLVAQGLLAGLAAWVQHSQGLVLATWVWPPVLGWMALACLGLSLGAAILPAWSALRQDAGPMLSDGA